MALDSDAVELVADTEHVAHVATVSGTDPHVTPVWYGYDRDRDLLEFLGGGEKVADVRENPKVALSIRDPERDWHVSVRGTATVIEETAEINAAARRILPNYLDGDGPEAWGVGGERLTFDPDDVLVRVDVGTLTARDASV